MKYILCFVGIVLILFGIISLAYNGITYTKHEKIAQIGDVQLEAQTRKMINIPPIAGGLSVVAGAFLVYVGAKINQPK